MHFFETIGKNFGNIDYTALPIVVLLLILLALVFDPFPIALGGVDFVPDVVQGGKLVLRRRASVPHRLVDQRPRFAQQFDPALAHR